MQNQMSLNSGNFEILYKKHIKAVHGVVKSFRFYDAAADDIVQEIFVKAWTRRETLREFSAFSGWLMQIARNCCLSEIKKQKNVISISGTDSFQENEEGSSTGIVLTAKDNGESLELEFSLALIRQAIQTHKHEERAKIAKLFYVEEMSVDQITEMLNMNRNTVLSHLHRFRLIVGQAVMRLVQNNDLTLESSCRKLLKTGR